MLIPLKITLNGQTQSLKGVDRIAIYVQITEYGRSLFKGNSYFFTSIALLNLKFVMICPINVIFCQQKLARCFAQIFLRFQRMSYRQRKSHYRLMSLFLSHLNHH